jgi:hypothetical protein
MAARGGHEVSASSEKSAFKAPEALRSALGTSTTECLRDSRRRRTCGAIIGYDAEDAGPALLT